ncbi:MAG: 50S ribosomal protein L4, partial [Anaerolineae bacterium]|nr:50S ribosomal protein L4 [Anaerolineae bacterium]
MDIPMYNARGEKIGEVELRPDIFEVPVNVPLMHQALVRQLANAHLGTHKTKSRGEVNRTKAKWYRQKGTGRARHGSRNANLFVGGGVAHGPRPRKYTKKMPRKMRRAALCSALSVKATEDQIVVLDALEME